MAGPLRFRHLLLAAAVLWAALFAGVALLLLAPAEDATLRQPVLTAVTVAALAAALLLAAVFLALALLVFLPLARLEQEVRIVARVNPGYAIAGSGRHLLGQLPDAVSELGQAFQAARQEMAAAVAASSRAVEEDRARLETILTATREGIIVCDERGRILFYNPAAREVFQEHAALAIGRSLYQLCTAAPIDNSLALLRQRQLRKPAEPAAGNALTFVCSTVLGTVIRSTIRLLPPVPELAWSFVLTCEDVSRQAAAWSRRHQALRDTMAFMRRTVTSLSLHLESLAVLRELDAPGRAALDSAIAADASSLIGQFGALAREIEAQEACPYLESDILTEDVAAWVGRRLASQGLRLTQTGDPLWVRADINTLLLLLEHLALKVFAFAQVEAIEIETLLGDRLVYFNLSWHGRPVPEAEIRQWKAALLDPLTGRTVAQALEDGGSEVWSSAHETPGYAFLRFPLPCSSRQWTPAQPRLPARPIYTDFIVDEAPADRAFLQEWPLSRIPFVVFDTETTGLAPLAGDEIVSLAGVKIVNRGIVVGEAFDRLVHPGRSIPPSSVRFHGITDDQVRSMPRIEEVLPLFHAFVGEAVLVGHNAAFDLRFLRMKERRAGVTFTGPVLDTLALSRHLHGHTPGHSLDAVAQRLGVEIHGRHTALGDALITAQVFLKLLHLLEAQGITTLGQLEMALQAG
ncbi:MAG: exonuclease domain-containing protein [Thermodesulfobacteriota bacterium]